ncbi:mitochondrial carrier domain-containing protein [Bisporella sp. PMI_857]|nr:mitochondrial carrier domain-containing protein [Bisporella sp. PMI_857]
MERKEKAAVWSTLLAGSIAGASETVITFPAEYVKTRRQLPRFANGDASSMSIIRSTLRDQGFRGFYSGCGALVVSNALKSGIRFLAYGTSREYLQKTVFKDEKQASPWVSVFAGLSAGIIESLLVVTPGEALKTRMVEDAASIGRRQYADKGVAHVAKTIIKEEGIRALWRGAVPILSKQATNSAVRFTSYGVMQEQVAKRWPTSEGRVATTLAIGALSGVVTVYASMPFDTVKTRMQMAGGSHHGMLNCAAKILQTDGIRGFWKGTSPRLVRLTLSSGITFMVYDQVVQALRILQKIPQPQHQLS